MMFINLPPLAMVHFWNWLYLGHTGHYKFTKAPALSQPNLKPKYLCSSVVVTWKQHDVSLNSIHPSIKPSQFWNLLCTSPMVENILSIEAEEAQLACSYIIMYTNPRHGVYSRINGQFCNWN